MRAMTSANNTPQWVIGLMSGTSADGVDAALIKTDGEKHVERGPSLTLPYNEVERQELLGLMKGQGDRELIARGLTIKHIEAVEGLIKQSGIARSEIKLIGFHGQTVRHAPHEGITEQIGLAPLMVAQTGISVVSDFRSRDVAQGGQGAPLVPLYHAALATNLPKPLMIVNIGGVANVTYLGAANLILAFDCGPGNALMDDWMRYHAGQPYDVGGELASRGVVDMGRVANFLNDPFFALPAPKSLDRNHFSLQLAEGLTAADGVATLAALTVEAIAKSFEHVNDAPKQLLVAGGGRHNATLMGMLAKRLNKTQVGKVDELGWNGDAIEAEAFAYLAMRCVKGLPISLPATTGVPFPVTGGALHIA